MFFRGILMLLHRFSKRLRLDEEGIEYALRRPRMVSFMVSLVCLVCRCNFAQFTSVFSQLELDP